MKDVDFEKVLIRVCAEQQTTIDELRQEIFDLKKMITIDEEVSAEIQMLKNKEKEKK